MLYCESIDGKEEAAKEQKPEDAKDIGNKKNKRVGCLCIVFSVLLVLTATVFFFGEYILNGVLSICPPELQFKYVCLKNVLTVWEDYSEHGALFAKNTLENKTTVGTAEFDLETAGALDKLADFVGFKSTPFVAEYSITKNKTASALDVDISYGKKHLLTFEARADYREGEATVKIPELYKRGLSYKVEKLNDTKLPNGETVKDIIPEEKLSKKLMAKYLLTVASCLDDVEREKQELTVGEVTREKTKLWIRVSTDTLLDIGEKVLEKALKDKDLKKHIINNPKEVKKLIEETFPASYGEYKSLSGEELYGKLCEDAKKALESIEKARKALPDAEYFALSLWINNKGEVVALDAKALKSTGVYFATLATEEKRFWELCAYVDPKNVATVEGEYCLVDNTVQGELCALIGTRKINLEYSDIDKDELKNGNLCGDIRISDSKTGISCSLKYKSDKNGQTVDGSVGYRASLEFKVSAKGEKTKAREVSLHTECIDFSKWNDVFSKERVEKLLQKTILGKLLFS